MNQDFDVYKFDVICPGLHTLIIKSTGPNQLLIEDGRFRFPLIEPQVYGPGSTCQAQARPSPLSLPVFTTLVNDVCGSDKDMVYFDETTFAFTLNVEECGSYLFQVYAPDQAPTCDGTKFDETGEDVNCGLGGGFLYSFEVTEGVVKGNELGATYWDDECRRE